MKTAIWTNLSARLLTLPTRSAARILALLILLCPFAGTLHAQITPPPPADRLLDWWTFADSTWESDYGYAPLAYTNITFVTNTSPGGRGGWLLLDTTNNSPAYLIYNTVENDGNTNLMLSTGTVSVFFSPNWSSSNAGGTGPGTWGRLFEAGTYTTNASIGWLSLYLSPDGSTVYFSGQTNNGYGGTYLSAPVNLTNTNWYNFALTYGPTNSSLFLNGEPLTNGTGVTWYPGQAVLTNGFSIGSSAADGLSQARGTFGDISSYSYELNSNTIYLDYITYSAFSYGGGGQAFANALTNAPSNPSDSPVTPDVITGPGYLTWLGSSGSCVTSSNVWLTNMSATATAQGMTFTFTIAGGTNGLFYDVFATSALEYPITNAVWTWMGQGNPCNTYAISNISSAVAIFILGTPQMSDGDGLTDAYQRLITHTNPYIDDQDGSGLSDGWQVLLGLNPLVNQVAQPGTRANYTYDSADRFTAVSGIKSGSVSLDNQGNVLSVSQ